MAAIPLVVVVCVCPTVDWYHVKGKRYKLSVRPLWIIDRGRTGWQQQQQTADSLKERTTGGREKQKERGSDSISDNAFHPHSWGEQVNPQTDTLIGY